MVPVLLFFKFLLHLLHSFGNLKLQVMLSYFLTLVLWMGQTKFTPKVPHFKFTKTDDKTRKPQYLQSKD